MTECPPCLGGRIIRESFVNLGWQSALRRTLQPKTSTTHSLPAASVPFNWFISLNLDIQYQVYSI
jgi:hypothetical protein